MRWIVLIAAGVVLGVFAFDIQVDDLHSPTERAAAQVVLGWTYVAVGLLAWIRRRGNPIGPLLVAAGLLKVRSYHPDVAIVDVRMPPTHTDEGARAAVTIRELQLHPEVGVLLLSQVIEATFALRLFTESPAGVGYLLKDRVLDVDDFVDALRRVARGGTAIDPAVVGQLLGRTRPDDPIATLTDRERSVMELMAEGRSNAGIGHKLFLSPKTVETHVHAIFSKLDLAPAPDDHRRVLAVLAFLDTRAAEPGGRS